MELTTSNLHYHSHINRMKFTRSDAEAVYRLLLEMGATKDIKFNWDEKSMEIHIMKKIHGIDEMPNASQYYRLADYMKLLIRFDRAAHKRMKNVESKINQMHLGIQRLKQQL